MIKLTDCPYVDEIQRAMQAYVPQWDWRWGVAQLYQESLWNPQATSGAGAQGIAQFMPDTWADMVNDMGLVDTASPFDPQYAIPAYAYYMRKLRNNWTRVQRPEDDRRRITQACYNCGVGNMLNAQQMTQGATDYYTIVAALPQVTNAVDAKQTSQYVLKIAQWFGELSTGPQA